ncbi:MAG TPA: hypothetical protein VER55_15290 [Ardenticatenaceae bacterium]|nr:hypothetical protein [Ardenticatenaceae bacterium]
MGIAPGPRTALERQIRRLERRIAELQRHSDRYGWMRVILFFAAIAVGLAVGSLAGRVAGWSSSLLVLGAFFTVVFFHRRVDRSLARHQLLRRLKQTHLARMDLDWPRLPPDRFSGSTPEHPFEGDLDLVGEHSLHRLLDTALSREGSQRLREWLAATDPDFVRVRERQARVRELAPLSLYRHRLQLDAALALPETGEQWESLRLLHWLSQGERPGALRPWLLVAAALALLNAALLALDVLGLIPSWWVAGLVLAATIYFVKWREAGGVFELGLGLQAGLERLVAVFKHVERSSYRRQPHVRVLCAPFLDRADRPSGHLRRVARLVAATGVTQNPVLKVVVNLAVPWDLYFAHRLSYERATLAARVPAWLDTWFELEALASLATFAALHPDYAFPEIHSGPEPASQPPFRAVALGHPLIPAATRVCNDFALDALGQVVLITGSNMSGKSSFLRTVGANLCLAYAGGPVVAQALEAGRFRLFTCIHVSDSVVDGISYFYAEVVRLRALLTALELDHPLPLFFLIDEIFRGTNNRERLIGSRAYLRAVVGRRGLGLVSTHDLELVRLAESMPALRNAHFREFIQDGTMRFDYRLRPGPSPTTNALTIMRLAGLPVEEVWRDEANA